MRQLKLLPQTTAMAVQLVVVLISMFLLDITHSSESASAFSSANKATSPEASSSLSLPSSSSNRHKRRVTDEAAFFGDDSDTEQALEVLKRAPGWGKRFYETVDKSPHKKLGWGKRDEFQQDEEDQADMDKRAPGWGKRAPGWGKRAPGWGKRAPGWGKRAPGWGKRAPGWGKRAPGWGKRSDGLGKFCQRLDDIVESLSLKAREVNAIRQENCGSQETDKELFRK